MCRNVTFTYACKLVSMSFRKPFRAVPIKLGPRYRDLRKVEERRSAVRVLGGAALLGVAVGTASLALTDTGRANIVGTANAVAVKVGAARARPPQMGDHWGGCNEARSAGTAPIYRGEPGYRDIMDDDGDGIACEPYRGS